MIIVPYFLAVIFCFIVIAKIAMPHSKGLLIELQKLSSNNIVKTVICVVLLSLSVGISYYTNNDIIDHLLTVFVGFILSMMTIAVMRFAIIYLDEEDE